MAVKGWQYWCLLFGFFYLGAFLVSFSFLSLEFCCTTLGYADMILFEPRSLNANDKGGSLRLLHCMAIGMGGHAGDYCFSNCALGRIIGKELVSAAALLRKRIRGTALSFSRFSVVFIFSFLWENWRQTMARMSFGFSPGIGWGWGC
jgi:hypothetical protein